MSESWGEFSAGNLPEDKEKYVKEGLFDKVKRTAGKIPFVADALAMYFCALDTDTPIHAKMMSFAALAYFIFPADAIPDIIPLGGYADDAGAIAAAVSALAPYITEEHKSKAKEFLSGSAA